MSEPSKGILFNAEMVRALLNTKVGVWPAEAIDPRLPFKCQTRRQAKPNPINRVMRANDGNLYDADCVKPGLLIAPRYKPGDVLCVRETFLYRARKTAVIYRADLDPCEAAGIGAMYGGWKPSIFLPRKFSRIWLKVVEVRVQRIAEISFGDCLAEGMSSIGLDSEEVRRAYMTLWDSINGKGSWMSNPWVFAYTFARVK